MKKSISDFRSLLRSVPPLLVSLLILSVVGMNLLANKSINTGLSWLALDCGILFSWLTFLSMDVLTHCYGPRAATALSFAALGLNLLMAGIFFLAKCIPGVWSESFVPGSEEILNAALDNTFGGAWFIILGSSVAFLASAALNNFLNYGIGRLLKRDRGFGGFALRSYVSTFLAQFADNLIFALLVSRLFFGWTLLQCFTCALTGAVTELLFEIFFSPLGYRMSRRILREREHADKTSEKGAPQPCM
ncbi:MAG: VUT family protein [Oscillospiraceae bacterium]|nr:VUT family protein [Oscillospiraceae bacterium]